MSWYPTLGSPSTLPGLLLNVILGRRVNFLAILDHDILLGDGLGVCQYFAVILVFYLYFVPVIHHSSLILLKKISGLDSRHLLNDDMCEGSDAETFNNCGDEKPCFPTYSLEIYIYRRSSKDPHPSHLAMSTSSVPSEANGSPVTRSPSLSFSSSRFLDVSKLFPEERPGWRGMSLLQHQLRYIDAFPDMSNGRSQSHRVTYSSSSSVRVHADSRYPALMILR